MSKPKPAPCASIRLTRENTAAMRGIIPVTGRTMPVEVNRAVTDYVAAWVRTNKLGPRLKG